jgi:hypothetical protein
MSQYEGPPDPAIRDRDGNPAELVPGTDKLKIYDREGRLSHVDRVDAREILAGGQYFAVNPVATAKAKAEADALDEAVAKRRAGATETAQGGGREKAAGGN